MSAKQPETRERRLGVLISLSERAKGVPPFKRPTAGKTARRGRS
jgi:hypothetical protein